MQTEKSRADSACCPPWMRVSKSYLLSQPPGLIVGPSLLNTAPQMGALCVKLPGWLLQDPPIGCPGLLAKEQDIGKTDIWVPNTHFSGMPLLLVSISETYRWRHPQRPTQECKEKEPLTSSCSSTWLISSLAWFRCSSSSCQRQLVS
jgi:hypothetical protein